MDLPALPTLPSLLANTHHACYKCGKFDRSREVKLQRCAGCKRVSYCGSECQKADWPNQHSQACKALQHFEKAYAKDVDVISRLQATDDGIPFQRERLNVRLERISHLGFRAFHEKLGRPPTVGERNLLAFEPRCLACGRSDAVLRIQASLNGDKRRRQPPSPAASFLHPCPDCELSFYCSEAHRDLAVQGHTERAASPSGGGGQRQESQCTLNQLAYQDAKFVHIMDGAKMGNFKWAPERTKPGWSSLRGLDWGREFRSDVARAWPPQVASQVLRAVTEGLAMPMTVLWALENLNDDDSWTRKETLHIQLIGADVKEFDHSMIFEEIMHRVPEVKVLKLDFIGPDIGSITRENFTTTMDTCPDCSRRKRTRAQNFYPMDYQRFIARPSSSSNKPDLAVAFNSGASEEGADDSWFQVMEILVRRKVPSVFTSYNEHEALEESRMLKAAGADLHPELGPRRNVWGSMVLRLEPNAVTGFYGSNAWLAGGFR